MFVRKKSNKSGSTSIQIIDKSTGRYKLVKTVGNSKEKRQIEYLWKKAHYEISELIGQTELGLLSKDDQTVLNFLTNNDSIKIRVIGPEEVFGKLFDGIGFNQIQEELFRYLVITRIVYPGSKLKTVDYIERYNGIRIDISKVYRFLDKLNKQYKKHVEEISFNHTKEVLKGNISVVFYDITTLYFEASNEDDLRKVGFSKDGKAQNPQILLGLLVGLNGYPIGYEIFEGNKFEGYTFIPVLEKYQKILKLNKPVIVADAGLLSKENIEILEEKGYKYILGGKIKNETEYIRRQILNLKLKDGETAELKRADDTRLIITYSTKRSKKDQNNRTRGLKRLEKSLLSKKLTKKQINNRGFNKYLKLIGAVNVEIDYEKFNSDANWDGLKGYITNSDLEAKEVIENYKNLWQIEKAFRISKTDLKVRPIYHRLRRRIESHICIAFVAYTIYKELERLLKKSKALFSIQRAIELTQTIYAMELVLPESKMKETIRLSMNEEQKFIYKAINNEQLLLKVSQ